MLPVASVVAVVVTVAAVVHCGSGGGIRSANVMPSSCIGSSSAGVAGPRLERFQFYTSYSVRIVCLDVS